MLRLRTALAGFLAVAGLTAFFSFLAQGQTKPPAPVQSLDLAFITRLAENQKAALTAIGNYCYNQDYLYEKLSETDEVQRRDFRTEVLCQEEGGLRSRALTVSGVPTGAHENDPWPPLVKDAGWQKRKADLAERNARWLKLAAEVPRAAIFTRLREDVSDGRKTTLFQLTPNPAYKPRDTVTEMLTHLTGQAWIDMQAAEMVRMLVRNESDFNLMGGLLLKVRKGGWYDMRQCPVNGVWVPWYQEEYWHARIALVKNVAQHQRISRSKFQLTSAVMARQNGPQKK